MLEEARPALERAALHGKSAEARVAAVEALGMLAFIAAEDQVMTDDIMQALVRLWKAGELYCMLVVNIQMGAVQKACIAAGNRSRQTTSYRHSHGCGRLESCKACTLNTHQHINASCCKAVPVEG